MLLDLSGFASAGIHAWTTGGVGVVTLAVMTRATKGHTGQALTSPHSTTWLIYAPIIPLGTAEDPGRNLAAAHHAAIADRRPCLDRGIPG